MLPVWNPFEKHQHLSRLTLRNGRVGALGPTGKNKQFCVHLRLSKGATGPSAIQSGFPILSAVSFSLFLFSPRADIEKTERDDRPNGRPERDPYSVCFWIFLRARGEKNILR